jgi:hypothetical protein
MFGIVYIKYILAYAKIVKEGKEGSDQKLYGCLG